MCNSSVSTVFINGSNTDYLLFKIAIHYAEEGTNTWFISPKPIQHFPQNLSIPNKEILKFILFFYLQTAEDLVKKLNSIHVWEKMPEVIIISDYQHYTHMHKCANDDNNSNSAIMAAYVTASLHDAALAVFTKITRDKQLKQMNNNKRTTYAIVSTNYNAQSKQNQIIIKSLVNLFFKVVLNTHNKTCEDSFSELIALLK